MDPTLVNAVKAKKIADSLGVRLRLQAPKVHMLVLHTGYVEECSTGCLILWHPNGFDTVEDAIESIAVVFKEVWEENEKDMADYAGRYQRCPHCKEPLHKEEPMTAEDIAGLVQEYQGGIVDGSHSLWEPLQNYGWETGLYDAPRDMLSEAVIVAEYADAIIGIVAAGDLGEYLDYVERWESHMKVPDGMVLRRPKPENGS